MQALVLEKTRLLGFRDFALNETFGTHDVRPFITDTCATADSIAAFNHFSKMQPTRGKVQIVLA